MILFYANNASLTEIKQYLVECAGLFNPPLYTHIDISDYAKKIYSSAYICEARAGNKLAGLIACYLNNTETFEGFITHISVLKEFQGQNIATQLIKSAVKKADELHFQKISLEVDCTNAKAISLYKKCGFMFSEQRNTKYQMIKYLYYKRCAV
jgi:ribosomal protein S18 acetylase RimI-like enzyme